MSQQWVEVPWQELEADTLYNLVSEFVTRDGTDYGEQEVSTEQKVEQVIAGIKGKRYLIVFDGELEQCNVISMEDWREFQRSL
ncbi:MAG: YheU family protein [Ketobacteraceae bacterium]|nr:YheU family protein [Ketobacteraceae bacterium]